MFVYKFVNPPPTYKSVPNTVIVFTELLEIPEPRADHADPFHFAIRFAGFVNAPPTYKSVPNTAIVFTDVIEETPEPRADQADPSHLAIPLAGEPPAVVNEPPT